MDLKKQHKSILLPFASIKGRRIIMKTDIIRIEVKEQTERNEPKDTYHFLIDPINQCSDSMDKASQQVSKFDDNIKKTEELLQDWLIQNYEVLQTEIAAVLIQIKQSGTMLYTEFELTASGIQDFRRELQKAAETLVQTIAQIFSFKNGQTSTMNTNANETGGMIESAAKILSLSSNIIGITSALNESNNPIVKLIEKGVTAATMKPIGKVLVVYDSMRQISEAFEQIEKAGNIKDPAEAVAMKGQGLAKLTMSTILPTFSAVIGNAIAPGIGGWIGAGVGNLLSNLYGFIVDSGEKKYKEKKLQIEQAKYSTKELKDALADTNITAEEFAKLFEKAVGENIQQHFQGVILSLEEIQKIAQKIVFGDDLKEFQRFAAISEEAQQSLMNLEGSSEQIEQWKWKIGVGIELEPEEEKLMLSDIDALIKDELSYFDDIFYQTTRAIHVLAEDETVAEEMLAPITKTFLDMREGLVQSIRELQDYMNNTETIDYSIMMDKVGKVQEKTKILSDAQSDAEQKIIQEKYKGKVSLETYDQMHNEYVQGIQTKTDLLDNALKYSMIGFNMAEEAKNLKGGKYLTDTLKLGGNYTKQIEDTSKTAIEEELINFIKSYKEELNFLLPGKSENELKEYLEKVLGQINNTTNPKDWDENTIFRYIGLERLKQNNFQNNDAWEKEIGQMRIRFSEQKSEEDLTSKLKETLKDVLENGTQEGSIDVEQALEILGLNALGRENKSAISTILQKMISSYPKEQGSDIMNALQKTDITEALKKTDFTIPFYGKPLSFTIIDGLPRDLEFEHFLNENFYELRKYVEEKLNDIFSDGFKIETDAAIQVNYNVGFAKEKGISKNIPELDTMVQRYYQRSVYMGGDGPIRQMIQLQANGNIISSPTLSIVGEAGPEAIIPLSASRRSRGISLWEQAGEMLGMFSSKDYNSVTYSLDSMNANASGVNVQIDVQLAPSFAVTNDSHNEEDVVSAIHSNLSSMAEELSGQIAVQLQNVFSNMPLQRA